MEPQSSPIPSQIPPSPDPYSLGVFWYVGAPTSGKTTLALANLGRDVVHTRWPALIIDSQGVHNLAGLPHCSTVRETIEQVWRHGTHAAYTPTEVEEVSALAGAIRRGKRVHVLVDEARYWMSAHSITPELSRLMRVWQHSQITIHLTSQRLEDVHQDAIACTTRLYAFRTVSPRTLERLEREFGMDPNELRNLDRGRYVTWNAGF